MFLLPISSTFFLYCTEAKETEVAPELISVSVFYFTRLITALTNLP
jgi:hypothetical protein